MPFMAYIVYAMVAQRKGLTSRAFSLARHTSLAQAGALYAVFSLVTMM